MNSNKYGSSSAGDKYGGSSSSGSNKSDKNSCYARGAPSNTIPFKMYNSYHQSPVASSHTVQKTFTPSFVEPKSLNSTKNLSSSFNNGVETNTYYRQYSDYPKGREFMVHQFSINRVNDKVTSKEEVYSGYQNQDTKKTDRVVYNVKHRYH